MCPTPRGSVGHGTDLSSGFGKASLSGYTELILDFIIVNMILVLSSAYSSKPALLAILVIVER